MDKFKIMIGKNRLTEEEMKESGNFSQLLKKHQQFKMRKRMVIGGVLAVGVLLLSGLFFYPDSDNVKIEEETTHLKEVVSIQTPLNLTLHKDTLIVNNQLGGVFYHHNTKITIPKNAFVDAHGELIQGNIEITYKEFHTPVEAFVSGIPMTYDSADTKFHFETAGMFEIRGYHKNNSVMMKETIQIELASFQLGNSFNQYYFDEDLGNWKFIQKDKLINRDTLSKKEKKKIQQEIDKITISLAEIEKNKPILKTKNSVCIKLELDSNEFPEFVSLKDVLFEIEEEDRVRYKKMAKTEWDDVKLIQQGESLELHIFKRFKKKVLKVEPVYEGKSFEVALSRYQTENKKAIEFLASKRKTLSQQLNSFSNEVKYQSSVEGFVTRLFTINSFGIYNSDCPQRMPKGQLLAVEYLKKSKSPEKDTLKLKSLYLVEENKNTLYTIGPTSNLSYNPNNKCVLWGVTIDDKLVIYKAKEFEKIPLNYNSVFNLEMEVIEEDIFSEKQLIEQLEIEALFNSI